MIEQIFKDGGWLSQVLPEYHSRPGQIALAKMVHDSIQDERHLLAEAGTGIGKGFAYGIPAAIQAMQNNSIAVIVTSNITLQEQLINKDLPVIRELLKGKIKTETGEEPELRFALVKGMGNYLCPPKLGLLIDEHKEESAPAWMVDLMRAFKDEKFNGDRSSLDEEIPEEDWSQISASSDECPRQECPFYKMGTCPYFKASIGKNLAHVLVTNYHMLYSDVNVRRATYDNYKLLPDRDLLVFDEAHNAPEIAMGFQGFQVTYPMLLRMVNRLSKINAGKHGERLRGDIRKEAEALFKQLAAMKAKNVDILERPLLTGQRLINKLAEVVDVFKGATDAHDGGGDTPEEKMYQSIKRKRCAGWAQQCQKLALDLSNVCFGIPDEKNTSRRVFPHGHVYFLEQGLSKYKQNYPKLCCKVVDVASFFQDNIFNKQTVIAVSATLATDNNFHFVAEQYGLKDADYSCLIAPTPFDPTRVLSVIPDISFPEPNEKAYPEAVAESIGQTATELKGRTMALFTSHKNLNFCADYLAKHYPLLRLLVQKKIPRTKIISEFKADSTNTVILATSSFWQGVDIPGRTLSCVIVDKIPFPSPSDPVVWFIKKEGGNWFMDYSVPKAIISLKQGIGRLIRTENDFGAVVVLDARIRGKRYGSQFFTAFPHECEGADSVDDIQPFLETFAEEAPNVQEVV